ncbi:hypothetical protein ACWKSP_21640 [Micromonosporaceae bacterium Da 78-11]
MSRQVRYRVTAIVLGGFFLGTPLLMNGTASAEQLNESARQVTFKGGGMFNISCASRPNIESMTVPADSTIRLVNRTGHNAKLKLSGTTKGTLADHGSTEVVFRRGTTSVLLTPTCAVADEATPVLVTAAPPTPAVAMPNPIPVPTSVDPAPTGTVKPSRPDRPSNSAAGTEMPDPLLPMPRPHRTRSDIKKPADSHANTPHTSGATPSDMAAPAGSVAARSMPPASRASGHHVKTKSKAKTRIPAGTAGAGGGAPAFAGMPPGDQQAIVDDVPQVGVAPMTSDLMPATTAASVAGSNPTQPAAEPVAALKPMRTGGQVGLLGVIAAVCAVGVTVAAIRAIVSQRANQALMA